jgi:tetratricopeptide (TPR) repeat protein
VQEALEVIDEIRIRWGQPGARRGLARALQSDGHDDAAREVLEVILSEYERYSEEEMAPRSQRSGLAATLYLLERYVDARELYQELAEESPETVSYLGNLGVIAARLGDVDEARRISRELDAFRRLRLEGRNQHWRASIAAQMGELDRAARLLQQSHDEGRRLGIWLWHDVDLQPLRGHPGFEEFIRPKG